MELFRGRVLSLHLLFPCLIWIVEVVEDHHKGPLPQLGSCYRLWFHSRCPQFHSPSPIVGQTPHPQILPVSPSPAAPSQTSHHPPPVSVSSLPTALRPLHPISQTTPLCLHWMTASSGGHSSRLVS